MENKISKNDIKSTLNKYKVNIISWYDFEKVDSILLIGNIDKIIVEFLCKKFKKVMAIVRNVVERDELYKIANIYKNFNVIDELFFDIKKKNEKFNYILLMNYFNNNSNEDVINFINKISDYLYDDGKILAIFENKIGAKNIVSKNLHGFSKIRIENIISGLKLKFNKFYYVLPSKEYANIIFSDEYLPAENDIRRNLHFSEMPSNSGTLENEILVNILKDYKEDFKTLTNSFLVELGNKKIINNVKAVFYSNIRSEKYQIRTKILNEVAVKEAVYDSGKEHINTIKNNIDILKKCNINTLDNYDEDKIISRLAINCERLDDKFIKLYRKNDLKYKDLIEKFKNDMLLKLEKTDTKNNIFEKLNINIDNEILNKFTFIRHGLWDLTMQNIFLINEELYVYDQEWYEENIPMEFLLYRTILHGFEVLNKEEKDSLYKEFGVYEYKNIFYELEIKIQGDITNNDVLKFHANTFSSSKEQILENEKNNLIVEQNKLLNKQNLLAKEIKAQSELIDSEKVINLDLKNKNDLIISEKNNLISEISLRDNKINELQVLISNSKALKCTRKVKNITKNIIEKSIIICGKPIKFLYENVLSKKMKRKINGKAEYSRTLSKMLKIPMLQGYNNTMKLYNKKDNTCKDVLSQYKLENKTIGIHLHLYYEDLADEFYNYLSNIPYIFDLYISVRKEANIENLKKIFDKIINLNYLEIKISENSGRDFGPMFVLFAEKLKKYDYIMHIHSKKSLRSGQEQTEWRKYLLDNLLGSTELIMKEFYLMEKLNCGLVYPDAYSTLSIMSYVWLDEKELAKNMMAEMGIEFKDEFLEFSAGSMFWAKKDALKQLLDLNLTWKDFGKDKKQVGGTLEYVFERIPGTVAKHNNYNIAIYNAENSEFILNKANKGVDKYLKFTSTDYISILKNFDIITFDIFDTLIARKIFNYDDIFLLIEKKIREENIEIVNFSNLRKETAEKISKRNNGIYTINEIYEEFKNIANINEEQALKIKNMEIETITKLCVPRGDVLKIYNDLIDMNKKVILLCDTYLTKDIVQKILENCGYFNYYDIWLSSETKLKKEDYSMFNSLYSKYENFKIAHIGDDEQYDIHILANKGKMTNYTANGNRLLELSNYDLENKNFDLPNSILFGLVYNNSMFNSPFALHNNENEATIKTLFDFGYSILGPILLYHILDFIKSIKNNLDNKILLFASEEGYYLQKIYNYVKEKLMLEELNNLEENYLLITEKFIRNITCGNIDDIYKLFEGEYVGTLRKILYEKLGYIGNIFDDIIIELPRDFYLVKRIIDENYNEIINQIQYKKVNYLKYFESLTPNIYTKTPIFVTLENSKTYKHYFSKFVDRKIIFKELNLGNEISNEILNKFLISPCGEFKYVDENLNPYYSFKNNEKIIPYTNQIYEGIIKLIDDFIDIYGTDLFNIKFDKGTINKNYNNFCKESNKTDGDLKKVLTS